VRHTEVVVWLALLLCIWEVTGTHPLGASVVWDCTNKRMDRKTQDKQTLLRGTLSESRQPQQISCYYIQFVTPFEIFLLPWHLIIPSTALLSVAFCCEVYYPSPPFAFAIFRRLCSIRWEDDQWITNYKGIGRQWSWPNLWYCHNEFNYMNMCCVRLSKYGSGINATECLP